MLKRSGVKRDGVFIRPVHIDCMVTMRLYVGTNSRNEPVPSSGWESAPAASITKPEKKVHNTIRFVHNSAMDPNPMLQKCGASAFGTKKDRCKPSLPLVKMAR